jgi:hypothetical protein
MLRHLTFLVGLGVIAASCSSGSSRPLGAGGEAGASDVTGEAGASDATGEAGAPLASGSAGAPEVRGDAGAGGTTGPDDDPGAAGEAGSSGSNGDAPALSDSTLLYVYRETPDNDLLVALDLESAEERLVTDLTGDGSSGWNIHSFAISPDRRRIALASLYGPTREDNATGLATRRIWTLATDGTNFLRLTPTFPEDLQGRQDFSYSVGDPEWTADGARLLYDFGSYWWEGTNLEGGSFPWTVSASGTDLPEPFPTSASCTVIYPSRNPASDEFLFIHSVCVPGQGEGDGVYLYPAEGSTSPTQIVASRRAEGYVDVFLAKPAWFSDGSGFLFIGGIEETEWRPSLLAYSGGELTLVVPAPPDTIVEAVTVSPDSSKSVYCLRSDDGRQDLHLIDLTPDEPTDVALTSDGKSRAPSF